MLGDTLERISTVLPRNALAMIGLAAVVAPQREHHFAIVEIGKRLPSNRIISSPAMTWRFPHSKPVIQRIEV